MDEPLTGLRTHRRHTSMHVTHSTAITEHTGIQAGRRTA